MSGMGQAAYGNQTGRRLMVAADGNYDAKVGGVTIDWTAAWPTAGAGGVTLADGTFVKEGQKYLRFGTVGFLVIDGDGKQGVLKPALAATTLVRDRTFVCNETVVQDDPYMSDHAGMWLFGGRVYAARLQVAGAFPTLANLRAACPKLDLIED